MSTQTPRSGFTIIEVMLFLAITGALTVGVLVSGNSIGQQRYRDSVNSVKGLLQEQYNQVANVVNGDTNKPVCTRSEDTLTFDEGTSQARGTSECLVVGRFALVAATEITTYNLVGRPDVNNTGTDDKSILAGYAFALQSPEVNKVSWQARIVEPKSDDDALVSLLVLRSPTSGAFLTYVQTGDKRSNITGMINDSNMVQKDLCIDSGGGSGMTKRLAVRINAKASGQTAVEIPLEKDNICD